MSKAVVNSVVVSQNELEAVLSNCPDSIGSMAYVRQLTEPNITKKIRGTKLFHGLKVEKETELSVLLNTSYEAGVVNQLNKENKPKTAYKKGKNTMPIELCENNNFFGYYKGEAVIQYRPHAKSNPTTKYFVDGVETEKCNIPDILPKTYGAENQGTDKQIHWRKLYVSNILEITINKVHYIVK
jgi:hypothetical protein